MNTLLKIVQVAHAIWQAIQRYRASRRVDAVRADIGTEWVRKMGGSDKRGTTPGPKDSGRGGD